MLEAKLVTVKKSLIRIEGISEFCGGVEFGIGLGRTPALFLLNNHRSHLEGGNKNGNVVKEMI